LRAAKLENLVDCGVYRTCQQGLAQNSLLTAMVILSGGGGGGAMQTLEVEGHDYGVADDGLEKFFVGCVSRTMG